MKKPDSASIVVIIYLIGFIVTFGNAVAYFKRQGSREAVGEAGMCACLWPLYVSYRIQSDK
jgi:hypothetical protein